MCRVQEAQLPPSAIKRDSGAAAIMLQEVIESLNRPPQKGNEREQGVNTMADARSGAGDAG